MTGGTGQPPPSSPSAPTPNVSQLRASVSVADIEAEHAAALALVPPPRNEEALAILRGEQTPAAVTAGALLLAPQPPTPRPAATTASSIIADAKARCAEIAAQLVHLESLKAEKLMLERMIWAASTEAKDGT